VREVGRQDYVSSTDVIDVAEDKIDIRVTRSKGDRVYRGVVRSAGSFTFVVMVLIGTFLLIQAWPALRDARWSFLTEAKWNPDGHQFGIASLMLLTFEIAVVALAIAVPVAIGAALYITEYAPRVLRRPLTSLIDLLAAVPSIIYGLWGRAFLQPRLIPLSRWLSTHIAFIPIFKVTDKNTNFAASTFIAGLVVSLMTVPLVTAIIREVFSQAPPGEKEGALALGGTKWGMIRTVVLPFGRGGIIGGSMLGLGRALGETIAVALIISPIYSKSIHILNGGGNSIAAQIANSFSESSPFGKNALMAAGLALFAVTLIVNALASAVVARSRSGQATEI
jgi:phosphate transport system permease protein